MNHAARLGLVISFDEATQRWRLGQGEYLLAVYNDCMEAVQHATRFAGACADRDGMPVDVYHLVDGRAELIHSIEPNRHTSDTGASPSRIKSEGSARVPP